MINEFIIIQDLADTTKTKEKIAILRANAHNENLKKIFWYALNPLISYGIKKIPEYTTSDNPSIDFWEGFKVLDKFINRELTGNKGIETLRNILSGMSKPDSILLSRIIKRDLRCGVAEASVNKVWDKWIPEWPCMLCEQNREKKRKKIRYPAYVQTKMDGLRINLVIDNDGEISLIGRSGHEIDLKGAIVNEIKNFKDYPKGIIIDGEALMVDYDDPTKFMERKKGNGIISKGVKGTFDPKDVPYVRMVAWDIIPYDDFFENHFDMPYLDRLAWLTRISETFNSIILINNVIVNSYDEAFSLFEKATNEGKEGIVLKNIEAPWENNRSKNQIKFKLEKEADMICTGYIPGTGKYEGMIGSLCFSSSDSELRVNVGTGLDDEFRSTNPEELIGCIASIKFNAVIQDINSGFKSLFLPVLIEFRDDKTIADSTAKIEEL